MELNIPTFFTDDDIPTAESLPKEPEQAPLLAKEARETAYKKDQSLAVYQHYQANIKKSSQIKTEITKGAREGESIYSLFLKACKAISLMTDEEVFYTTIKRDTLEIYGEGLEMQEPLTQDIADTRARLDKLQAALEEKPDSVMINKAIQSHRERITRLESKLHN